jgi:hypothetical protein
LGPEGRKEGREERRKKERNVKEGEKERKEGRNLPRSKFGESASASNIMRSSPSALSSSAVLRFRVASVKDDRHLYASPAATGSYAQT